MAIRDLHLRTREMLPGGVPQDAPAQRCPVIDFGGVLRQAEGAAVATAWAALDDDQLQDALEAGLLEHPGKAGLVCSHIAQGLASAKCDKHAAWLCVLEVACDYADSDLKRALKAICNAAKGAHCSPIVWSALMKACASDDFLLRNCGDSMALSAGVTDALWLELVDHAASTENAPQEMVASVAQNAAAAKATSPALWASIMGRAEKLKASCQALEAIGEAMGQAGVADTHLWQRLVNAAAKGLRPNAQGKVLGAVLKALARVSPWQANTWCATLSHACSLPGLCAFTVKCAARCLRKVGKLNGVDPAQVKAAWDRVVEIAVSETGWTPALRTERLADLAAQMSTAKCVSEAGCGRCVDALRQSMGFGAFHPRFASLGAPVLAQLLANLPNTELWDEGPYGDIYEHLLEEALGTGRLNLDDLADIAAYRAAVRKAAPTIDWNAVAAAQSGATAPGTFCGFAELETAAGDWANSLKTLLFTMAQRGSAPAQGSRDRAVWGKLFRESIVPLLNDLADEPIAKTAQPDVAIASVFGAPQLGVKVGTALLGKLVHSANGLHGLAPHLDAHLAKLQAGADSSGLFADKAMNPSKDAWTAASTALKSLIAKPDFSDRYDRCYFYTVKPMDKDAAAALSLGRHVSCCMSPEGKHFADYIQRLVDPACIPIVATDGQGNAVAAAWTFIAQMKGDDGITRTYLVVDFSDAKPSYSAEENVQGTTQQNRLGNDVVKQLLDYVKGFAVNIGADAMCIGMQGYGRMEKFPVFTGLSYVPMPELEIVGPGFGPTHDLAERYTDNIGKAKGRFSIVQLRGEAQVSTAAPADT